METTHQSKFLTAIWKNLVMLNYVVEAPLLERFVPTGTELDSFEGKAYLSLVGFEFNHTRMWGFPVPFHHAFEEVNLRFYVRRSSKRGVVFLRDLVPKFAESGRFITATEGGFFNRHYGDFCTGADGPYFLAVFFRFGTR